LSIPRFEHLKCSIEGGFPEMLSLPARSRTHLSPIVVCLSSLLLIASVASDISAQGSGTASTGTGGNHMIQGKIFFPSGRRAEGTIVVKLSSLASPEITAIADSSGSFTFGGLSPGNYTVVVNAGDQYEIAREAITIDSDLNLSRVGIPLNPGSRRYTVMVTLQPKHDKNNAKTGVINASLADVPEEARAQYQKALDLIKTGDVQKAVDDLKAAVALYPKFALALNELGVQYLRIGEADKAVEPLRSATRLSPDAFNPKLNLGIALLETRQYAEAEAQLREALKISSIPTAHMYLGLTLVRLKNFEEAQHELETAISVGGDNPNLAQAHRYLGGLYWRKGDNRRAVAEFEAYLRLTPNAPDAERVRGTVKDLRAKL
jgi:tetratricopeptide (TPR) repeat protein